MAGLWKEVGHFSPNSIEIVCLQWLKASQGFTLGRYFPAWLLLVLKASLLFFWVVNGLPLSLHLESFYRSSTGKCIHMTCLEHLICFVLPWEPLSHFPSDLKEQDVTNGDATSLAAICWSRALNKNTAITNGHGSSPGQNRGKFKV